MPYELSTRDWRVSDGSSYFESQRLSNPVPRVTQDVDRRCALFSKTQDRSDTVVRSANLNGLPISQSASQGPPYTFPKFDEYGNLSISKERERLDYFAEELRSVPGEPGYIIEFRGKTQRQKRLIRAKRAKNYLVKVKKIDAKRIVIVDGGYQKEFKIELRLGPIIAK
jgi:hypothetical protein